MVWVRASAEPLLNDSGSIDCVVGTFVDITARHEAAKALRQSEERFKAQFRGIPIPTYIWRREGDDLVLTDFNVAAEEFTQGGIKDYLGITAREMYGIVPEIMEEFGRCLTEKVAIERTMPYTLKSTGETKLLNVKYVFVPPDTVMVHTEDITERARAEEALRESEEKLKSILGSMDDLVFVLDKDGYFVSFHQPSHENRLYRPPDEFMGKTMEEVMPPHVARMGRKAVVDLLATGKAQQFDYPLDIEGEERWFSAKVSMRTKNGNQFGGVTVVSRDITRRKRALRELEKARATLEQRVEERTRELVDLRKQAEQVAAMRERERLARELHDAVTQTLFSISLIADALPAVWKRDPEEGRQRVQELRAMTRGALSEMRGLLVEMRSSTLVEGRLDDLLHQLGETLSAATGLEIQVAVEGEGSVPDDLKVALYRITQEALNNVAKHADAGQARVRLRHLPGKVELTIRDDGKGFDPDQIPDGRFGLAGICERARLFGGGATIESQPDHGTLITVSLPLEVPLTAKKSNSPRWQWTI
jgi:PAS domain S-box-containing protein